MKATGAMIKEFVDNGWPGKPDELYYEGFYDDPDVPDIWDQEGEFALDLTTEYNIADFGEICQNSYPSKIWPFSHFFELWLDSEHRTHDIVTVTVRVPRDQSDDPKAILLGLIKSAIEKDSLTDWEVQE